MSSRMDELMLLKLREFIEKGTAKSKSLVLREIHSRLTCDREDILSDILSITQDEYAVFSELLNIASSIKSISGENCTYVYAIPLYFTKLNKTTDALTVQSLLSKGRQSLMQTLFSDSAFTSSHSIHVSPLILNSNVIDKKTPYALFDIMQSHLCSTHQEHSKAYSMLEGVDTNAVKLHKFVIMVEVKSTLSDVNKLDKDVWTKEKVWAERSWAKNYKGYKVTIDSPTLISNFSKASRKESSKILLDTCLDSYLSSTYLTDNLSYLIQPCAQSSMLRIFHNNFIEPVCTLKLEQATHEHSVMLLESYGISKKSLKPKQAFNRQRLTLVN